MIQSTSAGNDSRNVLNSTHTHTEKRFLSSALKLSSKLRNRLTTVRAKRNEVPSFAKWDGLYEIRVK